MSANLASPIGDSANEGVCFAALYAVRAPTTNTVANRLRDHQDRREKKEKRRENTIQNLTQLLERLRQCSPTPGSNIFTVVLSGEAY